MAQSIDAARATELIALAENVRDQMQEFIDELRAAADQTIDAGEGIAQGPGGGVPPHSPN